MSRFTQPSQDDGGYILVARLDNAKSLHSILKAVNFREVRECDDWVRFACVVGSCNSLICVLLEWK